MKTLTCIPLLAGIAWLVAVHPAAADPFTVTISAQNSNSPLGTAEGTDLPAESLVRFGYFNLAPNDVVANFHNISLLNASFIVLAECQIAYFDGLTVLDNSGQVTIFDAGTLNGAAEGLFGHDVGFDAQAMSLLTVRPYLWVLDASGVDTATQHGIFSDDAWAFATFGTASFDISNVSPLDGNDIYLATFGPEQSGTGFGTLNKLQSVPEPHAALLLTGTALAILSRSRKRP